MLLPQKSSKRGIWSSQFLRDLSQVVGRTPRDAPVPLFTRTSPWPTKSSLSSVFETVLSETIFGPLPRKNLATQATIFRSLRALRARNPKKVSKRVFLGVCKKVPENTRKVEKYPKKYPNLDFSGTFQLFAGIFGDFFADPQKDSFRDFFGISGPEGPETPVNGRLGFEKKPPKIFVQKIVTRFSRICPLKRQNSSTFSDISNLFRAELKGTN